MKRLIKKSDINSIQIGEEVNFKDLRTIDNNRIEALMYFDGKVFNGPDHSVIAIDQLENLGYDIEEIEENHVMAHHYQDDESKDFILIDGYISTGDIQAAIQAFKNTYGWPVFEAGKNITKLKRVANI